MHLVSLLDDLQDVALNNVNAAAPQISEFSLREEMTTVQSVLALLAEAKQQRFMFDLPDDPDDKVWMDTRHFRRVMLNLLENAIKFTPEHGSVHVSVAHKEGDSPEEKYYVFRIADDGIGMSDRQMEDLFHSLEHDPDQPEDESASGLSVVRELLERIGGSISIASKQGEGSVFTLKLPSRPPKA